MRYLILSDMHGNWEALSAVLAAVAGERFDAALVLGDLVGYGAGPDEVVEAVRALPCPVHAVRGNHDKVVAGLDDGEDFNHLALAAAHWTAARMSAENLAYVRQLAAGPLTVAGGDVVICHGSPLDEDAYLFSVQDARGVFVRHAKPVTFFGHTHLPTAYVREGAQGTVREVRAVLDTVRLSGDHLYLFNPGSIGQPRDRDPRAAFMTYDSDRGEARWHRVEYRVRAAQRRILEAGLPELLAQRLALGF